VKPTLLAWVPGNASMLFPSFVSAMVLPGSMALRNAALKALLPQQLLSPPFLLRKDTDAACRTGASDASPRSSSGMVSSLSASEGSVLHGLCGSTGMSSGMSGSVVQSEGASRTGRVTADSASGTSAIGNVREEPALSGSSG